MKWSSYSAYKPSGVEWLGDVPEGWEALPLRRLIKFVKTGNTPSGAEEYHFEDGGFNWYSPIDFSEAVYLGTASRSLSSVGRAEVRIFPGMTVMLVGIGATIGKVGLATSESSCNQQINAIFCSDRLDPIFATYYLKTMRNFIVKCGKFTTMPIINQDETKSLVVMVPPLPEQAIIANFLDRETGKIDTLVAKNRTLIERLKEKRTALISSVVTGKVRVERRKTEGQRETRSDESETPATDSSFIIHHSSFKTKPSGVEWLGEVPEEWKFPPLHTRYRVDLGKMLNEASISGNHLRTYLRNSDIQWDRINVVDLPEMDIGPWENARYTVRTGDLLVCEGGDIGRAALVRDDADGFGFQKALHRLRPLRKGENPRFMFFTLSCWADMGVFVAEGNPNTIPHLTGEKLRAYRFPLPPPDEQTTIADFLDAETSKIDTLIAKVETTVERLQEYRTALITAAVTGNIDVRGAVG